MSDIHKLIYLSVTGLDAIQRGMQQAPQTTRTELQAAMTEATLLVERETRELMPRVSGMTANSIASDAWGVEPLGVLGVVGSAQPNAMFVALGTKPHMPPADALVPWVRAVLGVEPKRAPQVAFLVARKIARKGTKGGRQFERAWDGKEAQVLRIFENAAARIAMQLGDVNGGGA